MRLGTDIISIERIRQAAIRQPQFAQKVLSASEYAQYQQFTPARQMEFLAGRFCAKEAYVKALHTGIGRIQFTDISIVANKMGAPVIEFAPITEGVHVSISHCREYATATVIIDTTEEVLTAQLQPIIGSESND